MKIIVDAFGGDNAPFEILKGAEQAAQELQLDILLTGDEKRIVQIARDQEISLDRMEIAHAPQVITMEDDASAVLKTKKDSSMARGLEMLAQGKGDAFVSAGNSGALVVGATMLVKRIQGIKRPDRKSVV